MISIFCKNVRGINKHPKHVKVKHFINCPNLGLIGLLEIKVRSQNVQAIHNNILGGWDSFINDDNHPHIRMCIFWRLDIKFILWN